MMRGRAIRRLALMLAISFVLTSVEVHKVGAGQTDNTSAVAVSSGADDAKRSFIERYAKAAARLEAGLARLHARGRFREFRAQDQQPNEWTALEFFVDGQKLRVDRDRDYGAHEPSTAENLSHPDAFLLTPEAAAHVIDPVTKLAWAKYVSEKPDLRFNGDVTVTAWRFLRASYCYSDFSLSGCLKDGCCNLDSVEPDPANHGWLHVSCHLFTPARDHRPRKPVGTLDLWLDEAQDFVIRKGKHVSKYRDVLMDVGPYVRVGGGGWLPKEFLLLVYDKGTAPVGRPGEPRPFKERIEFELLGAVDTTPIPASCFTLEALGVTKPRGFAKLWLFVAASLAILLAVVLVVRRRRFCQAALRARNDSSGQPGVSQ